MRITRAFGIEASAAVSGATVVVDVFRAFSAAAYVFDAGAEEIVLTAEVDDARLLAGALPGSILMGEVDGRKPDGFRFGNSPGEVVAHAAEFAGRTVIHRSSAGTRCARAALLAGARPLFIASLVVASATAAALYEAEAVTIIGSGRSGNQPAAEDTIAGDGIAGCLTGDATPLVAAAATVAALPRAEQLRRAPWAHPDDVTLCTATDRFDFAMQVHATPQGPVARPLGRRGNG